MEQVLMRRGTNIFLIQNLLIELGINETNTKIRNWRKSTAVKCVLMVSCLSGSKGCAFFYFINYLERSSSPQFKTLFRFSKPQKFDFTLYRFYYKIRAGFRKTDPVILIVLCNTYCFKNNIFECDFIYFRPIFFSFF